MEIKRITISESEWVIQLFDRYRIFYKQASDIDLARNFIRERLHNNESVIFVAFENNDNKLTPVGFTQLYPTYSSVRTIKNWILNDLYVEKEFRQKGIGEALIKTALEFAKKTGQNLLSFLLQQIILPHRNFMKQ